MLLLFIHVLNVHFFSPINQRNKEIILEQSHVDSDAAGFSRGNPIVCLLTVFSGHQALLCLLLSFCVVVTSECVSNIGSISLSRFAVGCVYKHRYLPSFISRYLCFQEKAWSGVKTRLDGVGMVNVVRGMM